MEFQFLKQRKGRRRKIKEQLLDIRGLVDTVNQIARDHKDTQVALILDMISESLTDVIEGRYKKIIEPAEPKKPRKEDD